MKRWIPSFIALLILALPASGVIIGPLPVTLQNGTTADANQVMSNFNAIVNSTNANAAALATTPQLNLSNVFIFPQSGPNATQAGNYVNAGQIQQQGLTYFADTGVVNSYIGTPVPAWTSYQAGQTISLNIKTTNSGASVLNVSGLGAKTVLNSTLSVLPASSVIVSEVATFVYDGTQFQLATPSSYFATAPPSTSSTFVATTAFVSQQGTPAGTVFDYAGTAVPIGYLATDGASYLRTDYPALFTAISTTWGAADGTHFNVPNFNGRTLVADGTGTVFEASTASSGNGFTVASNATKWITGQTVVLSNLSGFVTTASAGPTYFVVRISATNNRLATTLALAQAGTPDITISGTGTVTATGTLTARTVGQVGGEETHAMTSTELLTHFHTTAVGNSTGGLNQAVQATGTTGNINGGSTGGNAAMNAMQPFGVVKKIIKY